MRFYLVIIARYNTLVQDLNQKCMKNQIKRTIAIIVMVLPTLSVIVFSVIVKYL